MTYKAYAGIGSRETPEPILEWMFKIGAFMFKEGWTLRSGHARGADMAFENGVDSVLEKQVFDINAHRRAKEIYVPWRGFNDAKANVIDPYSFPFTDDEVAIAMEHHPAWGLCSPQAKALHTRNVRQIRGCEGIHNGELVPVKFVICWTECGRIAGGTGQALRIANSWKIPVFNLGSAKTESELMTMLEAIQEVGSAH